MVFIYWEATSNSIYFLRDSRVTIGITVRKNKSMKVLVIRRKV